MWGERKALGEDAEVEVLPYQIFNANFISKFHQFLLITITTRSIYTIRLENFRLNKVHNLSVLHFSIMFASLLYLGRRLSSSSLNMFMSQLRV